MSSINLLNIDVNKLFEQYSIAEINVIHKKIQEVIENKKEELRTMVGERYRDLLTAADTIKSMQNSSKALITEVDEISGYCKNLNDQHLLGFKTEDDTVFNIRKQNANKQKRSYFATMIQIKLLIILPDLIWSQLDRQQYYAATELYLFSRHINTGLQLNANNDSFIHKLPVAKKQWEIIRSFHQTIKHRVLLALKNYHLSVDAMMDAVMALLQLDRTTLCNTLKCFLNLRCTAFSDCLTRDKTACHIQDQILRSLEILYNSLDIIHQCFIGETALLLMKLKEQSSCTVNPTINRINSDDVQFLHLLPDIIVLFKPKFDHVTLSNDDLQTVLKEWSQNITAIADKELKELFQLVTNMNVIQDVKLEANNMRARFKLKSINDDFERFLNSKDFYELYYVPLINQRFCDIIHDNWSEAINDTYQRIENITKSGECHQINLHMANMWQEDENDLPSSLTVALNHDLNSKPLLMKFKGYEQQIIVLCTEFNTKLGKIINDINILLKDQLNSAIERDIFIDFLRETAQKQLNEFLIKLMSLQASSSESENVNQQTLLFLIYCCCALIELCPHVKLCFCYQRCGNLNSIDTPISSTITNAVDYWHDVCNLFENHVYQLWLKVIDNIYSEEYCLNYMPDYLNSNSILEDFPMWDCITLEQKDENDQTVQTVFHLPKQPRISLQIFLHVIIRKLNVTIPQNLPNRILKIFNEKLMEHLLQYYNTVLENHDDVKPLTQNLALQMYFDLKFLQNMFDIKENPQREQFNKLLSKYRNFIDPFDFELLASHLIDNVKKIVKKLSSILGVLVPPHVQDNNAAVAEVRNTDQSSSNAHGLLQENEPNILSLCSSSSTSIWFPLLPIINMNSGMELELTQENDRNVLHNVSRDAGDKENSSTKKINANNERKANNKKASSSSFFGTMSQEWFR